MPPQRSGVGLGGEYKMASAAPADIRPHFPKKASLLLTIAPTIRESDVSAFVEKVASEPSLVAGFRRSGIAQVLVEALENTKRASAEDRLKAVVEHINPTVVTIQKLPGGDFLVKSAAGNA